jgi:cellulose biosynthesis protein BcsQ
LTSKVEDAAARDKLNTNYFDYDGFLVALVRLSILAGDVLGGQDQDQLNKKV